MHRLLVLVPHERPHGIMRILNNPGMLPPKALKMRAIKDTWACRLSFSAYLSHIPEYCVLLGFAGWVTYALLWAMQLVAFLGHTELRKGGHEREWELGPVHCRVF